MSPEYREYVFDYAELIYDFPWLFVLGWEGSSLREAFLDQ